MMQNAPFDAHILSKGHLKNKEELAFWWFKGLEKC